MNILNIKVSNIIFLIELNKRANKMVPRKIKLGGKKLRVKTYVNNSSNITCRNYIM